MNDDGIGWVRVACSNGIINNDPKIDNRVCLFYVTDRLMELSEVKDKDLRKYIVQFKDECLRNLGVNALHMYKGD